jgi:hypothetical protein
MLPRAPHDDIQEIAMRSSRIEIAILIGLTLLVIYSWWL